MGVTDGQPAENGTAPGDDVGDAFGCVRNLDSANNRTISTHYKMNHARRGLALIFNHEFFAARRGLDVREGTKVDYQNLIKTLQNLEFEVQDFHNLTHKKIQSKLEQVAEMDHSDHDCLIVTILSHGYLGFLDAYDTRYKADSIWSSFTCDKCPTLAGKPKLIFIQACQGAKADAGTTLRDRPESDGPSTTMPFPISIDAKLDAGPTLQNRTESDDPSTTMPAFPISIGVDFLIAYSTIPDFYSWRTETHGSWFMEALCNELNENGTQYDILTLLTFVARRVALGYESYRPNDITMHQKKQIPCVTTKLTRLLKFPPPQNAIRH